MKNTLFKKGLVVGTIILFFGISVIPSNANFLNDNISSDNEVFSIAIDSRGIIYVDADNTGGPWDGTLGHPYQYIQDGVDNAGEGDTIYVFNGIYYEHIVIDKSSIKLIGENADSTIIDGMGCDSVILIVTNSNYIHICKFTIKNGINGIKCNSDYNKIYKNKISNNEVGIFIHRGINCKVYRNHIHNNTDRGIDIWGSFNTIIYNDIRNSEEGIFLTSSFFIGASFLNRIERNNLINNFDNAFFHHYDFRLPNQWKRNYWDDWGEVGPMVIYGFLCKRLPQPYYGYEYISIRNYDWFPAKKPYEIIITNNIEGCGIE